MGMVEEREEMFQGEVGMAVEGEGRVGWEGLREDIQGILREGQRKEGGRRGR